MFGTSSVTELQGAGLQQDPKVQATRAPYGTRGRTRAGGGERWPHFRRRVSGVSGTGGSGRGVNKGRQRSAATWRRGGRTGSCCLPSADPFHAPRSLPPASDLAVHAEGGWAGARGQGAAHTPCASPPRRVFSCFPLSPPPHGGVSLSSWWTEVEPQDGRWQRGAAGGRLARASLRGL